MEYERLTVKEIEDFTQRACVQLCPELTQQLLSMAMELIEYKKKIEQGTLIELPCKVGTIVYYVASYKKKIGFWGKRKYCCGIMEIPFTLEMLDTYGNNWFLSREKAEKRLKEYKNG